MHFRLLTAADLDAALALNDLHWPDIREMFATEFTHALAGTGPFQMRFGGIEHDGGLIGIGMVSDTPMTMALGGLSWIVVATPYRRQGAGRFLVRHLERVAVDALGKTDMLFTTDLPEFYETLGYRTLAPMAARPEWTDMVLMHRHLI